MRTPVRTSLIRPSGGAQATAQKIRYSTELGGGALMDMGWYPLNCVRALVPTGREALPVVEFAQAQKWPLDEEIDEGMKARLRFGRIEAEIICSYVGDGSDGFVTRTRPGSASPLIAS